MKNDKLANEVSRLTLFLDQVLVSSAFSVDEKIALLNLLTNVIKFDILNKYKEINTLPPIQEENIERATKRFKHS